MKMERLPTVFGGQIHQLQIEPFFLKLRQRVFDEIGDRYLQSDEAGEVFAPVLGVPARGTLSR
jgi:hypothetical protein